MRVSKLAVFSALFLVVTACQSAAEDAPVLLTDAEAAIPGLVTDIRYYGDDNFVGTRIDGYEAPKCLLTEKTVSALRAVQAELAVTGLGLKVFDCYRPAEAVAHFVRWAKDLDDQKMKPAYYPDVPKTELFARGYIAERSGHSRGSTLDVTVIDLATGKELDMGSGFDFFDTLSWPSDPRPTPQQRANRALLRSVMTASGFRPLKEEWWHFTLRDEPFPSTYHNVPVK